MTSTVLKRFFYSQKLQKVSFCWLTQKQKNCMKNVQLKILLCNENYAFNSFTQIYKGVLSFFKCCRSLASLSKTIFIILPFQQRREDNNSSLMLFCVVVSVLPTVINEKFKQIDKILPFHKYVQVLNANRCMRRQYEIIIN